MAQFTVHVLNTFVAPGFGDFTRADIPDLRPEFAQADYWLGSHILNTTLRGRFAEGLRQQVLGFIRRVHYAYLYYHSARDKTLGYLDRRSAGEQHLMLYLETTG